MYSSPSLPTRRTSPLSRRRRAQAIGPMLIEITTSALNVDRVEFSVDGVLGRRGAQGAVSDCA